MFQYTAAEICDIYHFGTEEEIEAFEAFQAEQAEVKHKAEQVKQALEALQANLQASIQASIERAIQASQATQSTPQANLPQPITSQQKQKKKRNQKTRKQYKRRSLQARQQEYTTEKSSQEQACTTTNSAQISVESSQCNDTKILQNSGILSVILHGVSKQIYGDVILPTPLAIAMAIASNPTYIRPCNDFEASGEG